MLGGGDGVDAEDAVAGVAGVGGADAMDGRRVGCCYGAAWWNTVHGMDGVDRSGGTGMGWRWLGSCMGALQGRQHHAGAALPGELGGPLPRPLGHLAGRVPLLTEGADAIGDAAD